MLLRREKAGVVKAVEHLLALQAQAPRPPHVALWSRVHKFERDQLVKALYARTLVRGTMMRGTLHIMSAKDFLAYRTALQPSLTAGMMAIVGQGPLPTIETLITAGRSAFGRKARPFADVRAALQSRFPDAHERLMAYAVRMQLPLVQVPLASEAWGFSAESDFALAEHWLKTKVGVGAGAGSLVLRYLSAFGPASTADIQGWLGIRGVAEVLAPIREKLMTFTDPRGREVFDLPNAPRPDADVEAPVRFLPEYDSVILAYADRSRIIDEAHRKALVTKNLIVPATFLVDGRIAGTWKLERKKAAATLKLSPFVPLAKCAKLALEEEGDALLAFIEPGASVRSVAF
jgi:Winged helix DNA-binding domain